MHTYTRGMLTILLCSHFLLLLPFTCGPLSLRNSSLFSPVTFPTLPPCHSISVMGKKKAGKNAKISQSNAARDADIAQHSLSNRYVKIKGNKKDAQPFYVEDDEDEVDAFHRENDRIDLDGEVTCHISTICV